MRWPLQTRIDLRFVSPSILTLSLLLSLPLTFLPFASLAPRSSTPLTPLLPDGLVRRTRLFPSPFSLCSLLSSFPLRSFCHSRLHWLYLQFHHCRRRTGAASVRGGEGQGQSSRLFLPSLLFSSLLTRSLSFSPHYPFAFRLFLAVCFPSSLASFRARQFFICGPPGQVAAIAGAKDGGKQGPIGGALASLGYESSQVFKF